MKKKIIILLLTYCLVLGTVPVTLSAYRQEPGTEKTPIVLVHGFAGWGEDELEGYNYWGGYFDIKRFLERNGYTVFTASVGAFSSNWDRAIELFYQIKGGQVDYGEEHCRQYGHIQRPEGMMYENPLYPEWDDEHPVHFIGHSMGGQTIRVLSALLVGKGEVFQDVLLDRDGSPFTPGEGWIKSITTISTPHNGIATFDLFSETDLVASIIAGFGNLELTGIIPEELYSFDLQQWGLYRKREETLEDYIERVTETLGDTEDFSIWELSTRGAAQLNEQVNFETVDRTACYFSYANTQTKEVIKRSVYVPSIEMNPLFVQHAITLGSSPEFTDPLDIGALWRENDGMVNTASMTAPLAGCSDSYVVYDGTAHTGVWNHMGTLWWDHCDMLGHSLSDIKELAALQQFYLELCEMVSSLE